MYKSLASTLQRLLFILPLVLFAAMNNEMPNEANAVPNQSGQNEKAATITQARLTLPGFRWPWDSSYNGQIVWTGGPHSWSKGGQLTAKISASRGNGLDFARTGSEKSFPVIAMADGIVARNACGFLGLGCIVAIRHSVGGSVMIYAHLEHITTSRGTFPRNDLSEGQSVNQGNIIGYAGQSGGQTNVHLHIELRNGVAPCYAPADSINGDDCDNTSNPSISFSGNPIGWEGRQLVDGYYINGYFDSGSGCGPGADCDTIFNYDGSAFKGSIAAPFFNFPYLDNGTPRQVYAFVHPDFIDQKVCDLTTNPPPTNCEMYLFSVVRKPGAGVSRGFQD